MMDNDETELERHYVNRDVIYNRKAMLIQQEQMGYFCSLQPELQNKTF